MYEAKSFCEDGHPSMLRILQSACRLSRLVLQASLVETSVGQILAPSHGQLLEGSDVGCREREKERERLRDRDRQRDRDRLDRDRVRGRERDHDRRGRVGSLESTHQSYWP